MTAGNSQFLRPRGFAPRDWADEIAAWNVAIERSRRHYDANFFFYRKAKTWSLAAIRLIYDEAFMRARQQVKEMRRSA